MSTYFYRSATVYAIFLSLWSRPSKLIAWCFPFSLEALHLRTFIVSFHKLWTQWLRFVFLSLSGFYLQKLIFLRVIAWMGLFITIRVVRIKIDTLSSSPRPLSKKYPQILAGTMAVIFGYQSPWQCNWQGVQRHGCSKK